eukprot:scaffold16798_cov19-Tisochrysis_lutea.AAC.1
MQASLMRSLAQLKLAQDPAARAAMEQQFDLSGDEEDEDTRRQEAAILAQLDDWDAVENAAEAAYCKKNILTMPPTNVGCHPGATGQGGCCRECSRGMAIEKCFHAFCNRRLLLPDAAG